MTGIDKVKENALSFGACEKVEHVGSLKDAVTLLMSAQGREFALKTGYPDLNVWRGNAEEVGALQEVFLDRGNVSVTNREGVFVGDTVARIRIDTPDRLYHIMVMHGAAVEVEVGNYAVVTVTNVGGEMRIINDGTAVINIEERKL